VQSGRLNPPWPKLALKTQIVMEEVKMAAIAGKSSTQQDSPMSRHHYT